MRTKGCWPRFVYPAPRKAQSARPVTPGSYSALPAPSGPSVTDLPSHHSLLAPYGVTFNDDIGPDGLVFTSFVPHPVTDGLTSIGWDYGWTLNVALPSMPLIVAPDPVVLSASDQELVVVFGDTSTFLNSGGIGDTDIAHLDNSLFALNIADWTTSTGPVSTDQISWGSLKALYR